MIHGITVATFVSAFFFRYSEVPIIRPPLVLVESGLNNRSH